MGSGAVTDDVPTEQVGDQVERPLPGGPSAPDAVLTVTAMRRHQPVVEVPSAS